MAAPHPHRLAVVPRLLTIGLLTACTGASESADRNDSVLSRDSAGVTILEWRGVDVEREWPYDRRFSLGDVDSVGGPISDVHPGWVAAGTPGQFVVLDAPGHRIVLFDSLGVLVSTRGRAGAGPGEFTFPVGISVSPDGAIGVFDAAQRAIVRLDANGQSLPPVSVAGFQMRTGRFSLGAPDEMLIEHTVLSQQRGDELPGREVAQHDQLDLLRAADTVTIARTAQTKGRMLRFPCGVMVSGGMPLLTPTLRWSGQPGMVAVATGVEYRIDIYAVGKLMRSIRRRIPPRRLSRSEVEQTLEPQKVQTPNATCELSASEQMDQLGMASVLPAIAGLQLAPDGTIWVERGSLRGEEAVLDQFALDGRLLGTYRGHPMPLAVLQGGLMLSRHEGDDGAARLEGWSPRPTR